MKDVFVVADAHGHHHLVAGLLKQEGLIDDSLARVTDDVVVQIGDLCNCVASSVADDLVCLGMAAEWFDIYLLGNHEHPYFGGPGFRGFWRDPAVERQLLGLGDLIQPSFAVEGHEVTPTLVVPDILVTHAGLTAERAGFVEWKTAKEADEGIRAVWDSGPEGKSSWSLFSGIGRSRGGWDEAGGILWADWDEPKAISRFSQVVGHTPGSEVRWQRQNGDFAVCVDLGGKHGRRIGGAWIRGSGVEPVEYVEHVA